MRLKINRVCISVYILSLIFSVTVNAQQATEQMKKLSARIEILAYPVHKASLLGLTSTELPTLGFGFSGEYGRWSFYGTAFHETSGRELFLSQYEQYIGYKMIDKELFSFTIFNTSVSTTKKSAVYMTPTMALAVGKTKSLKFDITPYTWGINTNLAGHTFAVSYNYSGRINANMAMGMLAKAVYTKINPVYQGSIAEISPLITWKSFKFQVRTIYQFSGRHFIYDAGLRKTFSVN